MQWGGKRKSKGREKDEDDWGKEEKKIRKRTQKEIEGNSMESKRRVRKKE